MAAGRLSEKSVTVLTLLAEGYGHSQILDRQPEITYLDICNAAKEALSLGESASKRGERLETLRRERPRAYEKWTDGEEAELRAMFAANADTADIAAHLQRKPSAIRSRLFKLGLIDAPQPEA
jgi:hypothetical protein